MWMSDIDSYVWSFYLTNVVALVLNATIFVLLTARIWRTRTVSGHFVVMARIGKAILVVSALYQVILSTSRLIGIGLPLEFRDTWILKDVGIFFYVISVSYLHVTLMSGKTVSIDPDAAVLAAKEKSTEEALQVGRHNYDERVRNGFKPNDRRS